VRLAAHSPHIERPDRLTPMSWKDPQPPILDYPRGLAIFFVGTIGAGLLLYVLLA